MTTLFTAEERARIDAEFDRLEAIATEGGQSIDRAAAILRHHRSARDAVRVGVSARMRFSDIAPLMMRWARSHGSPELYAQRLLAQALNACGLANVLDARALGADFIVFAVKNLRTVRQA